MMRRAAPTVSTPFSTTEISADEPGARASAKVLTRLPRPPTIPHTAVPASKKWKGLSLKTLVREAESVIKSRPNGTKSVHTMYTKQVVTVHACLRCSGAAATPYFFPTGPNPQQRPARIAISRARPPDGCGGVCLQLSRLSASARSSTEGKSVVASVAVQSRSASRPGSRFSSCMYNSGAIPVSCAAECADTRPRRRVAAETYCIAPGRSPKNTATSTALETA
mmetsp:Transcript_123496/g.357085  ORF Transcript_123496/g.357085 Transcript_123496/m.357085 type:complete len:223 (-) Transcript_123496:443-1111(-)